VTSPIFGELSGSNKIEAKNKACRYDMSVNKEGEQIS
jgi:hypothetical protein